MSTRLCSRVFNISNESLKVRLLTPMPTKEFVKQCVGRPMKYGSLIKTATSIDDIKKHFKHDSYYRIISGTIYYYDNQWSTSCIQFPK